MASDWRATTIGDLCDSLRGDIQTGPFGSQLHAHEYVPDGPVPVVTTSSVGRRRLEADGVPRISRAKADSLRRHYLKPGDIVFARRGVQAAGLSALVEPHHEGWLGGTGIIRLRLPSSAVNSAFLSFVLSTPRTYEWIRQHAIGATMPNLNEGVVRGVPVTLPPLDEQRRIAAVLGALDDKIELNRKMNRTLEEMAQALFKSWFIDFDGVPDTELVETGELGSIPKGWEVGTLGNVAKQHRLTVNPEEQEIDTPYIGLADMPQGSISLGEWGYAADARSAKAQFVEDDLLFGKLRPYFKKVGVAPCGGVCSSDIIVVRPKHQDWFGYVLGLLTLDAFIDFSAAVSTGTRMPRVSWKAMAGYGIALPPRRRAEEFAAFVRPAVDRIKANIWQSRTLSELRDALLPKLITGEIRVPKAEQAVVAAL